MSSPLKLVILYDAINHVYAVLGHNLTPEEAEKTVAEYRAKLLNAFSVEQRAHHNHHPRRLPSVPTRCRARTRPWRHAEVPRGGTDDSPEIVRRGEGSCSSEGEEAVEEANAR